MNRRLGLDHFTQLELPPEALVRHAARAGFGSVGFRFWPVSPGAVHYRPSTAGEVRRLRTALDGEGVTVHAVEVVAIDAGLDTEALVPLAGIAAALGAERINVCAEDWDHGALVAKFARVCEIADEAGLGVDLEWMRWRGIGTLPGARALIAESGAANATLLVDALHLDRCGGTAADIAALPAGLVQSAQLCDAPAMLPATREGFIAEAREGRLVPGEGALDLAALVAALPADAVNSVEIPSTTDTRPVDERFAAIFNATTEILGRAA